MKNINIIIFVGKFPQYSESFIIRKAYGLASKGYNVLVLSRRKGDLKILDSFGPLPKNLKIEWAIPDYGFSQIRTSIWALYKMIYYLLFYPLSSLKLYNLIVKLKIGNTFKTWLKYLSFVDKKKYQIIHFEFLSFSSSYDLIFDLFPQKKIFISCRGSDIHLLPSRDTMYILKVTEFLKKVNGIHCVSSEIQRFLKEKLSIEVKTSFINRPAVNPVNPPINKIFNRSNIPYIVTTGRLEWIKGLDYLLKALQILKNKNVIFKYEIIGDGSLKAELMFSIKDLGLENYVTLVGRLPNKEILHKLLNADIFVLSSHEEGISNAVLEAMSLTVPVISTNVGGMNEVIESGHNGILVPSRNPVALAEAIELLIKDTDLRKQISENGRKTIENDFSIERQILTFEEYYKKVLNG